MTSDDHPEPEQRGLQAEPEQLQAAWARVQESAEHFRQVAVGLPERLPAVAMPSMPDLTWREWFLFGCTGASILMALITAAIVITDMLTRGTQ